jgi:enolase
MAKITKLEAREISDSRGNPTLEVELELNNQFVGQAAVPAGASTGQHEAVALPASQAVTKVKGEISQKLIGHDFDQESLDVELIALDGTPNKNHLGANATLGVSLAFAHALALSQNQELFEIIINSVRGESSSTVGSPTSSEPEVGLRTAFPLPMFNILNGGRHASNSTDIQEFMIVPIGTSSFREALTWGQDIYQALKKILEAKNLSLELGDEGGFAPTLSSNTEALDLLVEAIEQAGYKPGEQVALALDVAANELKTNDRSVQTGNYVFPKGLPVGPTILQTLTSAELINSYEELIKKYPIISIEDGLGEDD